MKARIVVHKDFTIGPVDDRIYGSFIEHLGRAVYGGIFESSHPDADAGGFRRDVLSLVRELNISLVRYPGGNFVSSYKWEDGIGPVEKRPKRLDPAWKSIEPNIIGLGEFYDWTEKAGAELMMAVNLGTRGISEAMDLVEYCNHPEGTYWSDLRRAYGRTAPYNVRTWCLGNELDGPWQVGRKTAYEYGRLADETAKAIRLFDNKIELVVCGSSICDLSTFPDWEREVLEQCYENVDYLSLHMYMNNTEDDLETFMACSLGMDGFIETVAAVCDFVKAKKRSPKTVYLSFDEWNVWFHSLERDKGICKTDPWQVGPPLLEDVYTFEDALVVGMMLNSLLRHSDRVKIACLAQLVNVIAPIITERNGPAWRQTIYYPFYFTSKYGRGTSLRLSVECPCYRNEKYGEVPVLDAASVYNEEQGTLAFFLINRSRNREAEVSFAAENFQIKDILVENELVCENRKAMNTAKDPYRVKPAETKSFVVNGRCIRGTLKPLSWKILVLNCE